MPPPSGLVRCNSFVLSCLRHLILGNTLARVSKAELCNNSVDDTRSSRVSMVAFANSLSRIVRQFQCFANARGCSAGVCGSEAISVAKSTFTVRFPREWKISSNKYFFQICWTGWVPLALTSLTCPQARCGETVRSSAA